MPWRGLPDEGSRHERHTVPAACLRSLRAVVFDTDGVVIDSALVHAAAWRGAFDACLSAAGGQRPGREAFARLAARSNSFLAALEGQSLYPYQQL